MTGIGVKNLFFSRRRSLVEKADSEMRVFYTWYLWNDCFATSYAVLCIGQSSRLTSVK